MEDDPRSRGWPGPEVLPSRCRVSRKALNYTTRIVGFAGQIRPSTRMASCRSGAARSCSSERGRSSASGSIAGSSASTRASAVAAQGSLGQPLAQRRPGLGAVLGRLAIEEAEQLAVPAGQGAAAPRGRRRSASPTSRSPAAASRRCDRPAGASAAARRGAAAPAGTPGPIARSRAGRAARPRGPPGGSELVDRQGAARREFAEQLALQHAVGKRRPERATVRQEPGPSFGGGEVEVFAGERQDLARQRHGRGDRLPRTPRRRARARSCRGRARPAGTGSGRCACRWRAAGSPRGRARRRAGRRRRRRS